MAGGASIESLIRQAREGNIPSIAILTGGEAFLVERALDALREAVLGDSPPGFNEDVFQGQGLEAARLLGAARTMPMMAARRIVIVRRADNMGTSELEDLVPYVDSPAPETCLVLTAAKMDARGRFAKAVRKAGMWYDASPPKQSDMRSTASEEALGRGHRLTPGAASALADSVGTDLAALDDGLERLSLYVGEGQQISEQDVEACIAHVRGESIWALVDAVGARDTATALASVAGLLDEREPPLRILALIARQLRTVAKMRDALASGLRPQEAAQRAGAPPFKARDLSESAGRFDGVGLARAFALIDGADRDLKGSRVPGPRILEKTILELCAD